MKRTLDQIAFSQLEMARRNFLRASAMAYDHQDPRAQLVRKTIMHLLCGFDSNSKVEGHGDTIDTTTPLMAAARGVTEWHTEQEAKRTASKGTP